MKNFLLILSFLILAAGIQVKAAHPIPSYKTPVYQGANFQEKKGRSTMKNGCKEKRDMNVVVLNPGPRIFVITVYIYSLDGRNILGPFVLTNDNLSVIVPIDDREWGVALDSNDKLNVSVFITMDGKGGALTDNQVKEPGFQEGFLAICRDSMAILNKTNGTLRC